tara:strand:+ start:434 stop:598 length:165 start_codon:yes stop_codon:yes gene_type:complete
MAYIHNTIYGNQVSTTTNDIGNRSMKQIQQEIEELKKIDKLITDKVRSQYSLKK